MKFILLETWVDGEVEDVLLEVARIRAHRVAYESLVASELKLGKTGRINQLSDNHTYFRHVSTIKE